MKIDAHIIVWNEAETIHLTIKHYQQFCQQVIIYDNHSIDNTAEIALSMHCLVRPFGIPGQLNDFQYLTVKNHCWKGSDADYVIVCDSDEILYHPNLTNILKTGIEKQCTIFHTVGFNMYSNDMPVNSWLDIKTGVPDDNYSKYILFSPKLSEINYIYGCHVAKPKGWLNYAEEKPLLLHYRAIGGVDRMIKRHNQYKERLSEFNKKWGLGIHYSQSDEEKRTGFAERLLACETLSLDGIS